MYPLGGRALLWLGGHRDLPNVSTRRVSPIQSVSVFGVCNGLVSRDDPLAITVLYPREDTYEALPK